MPKRKKIMNSEISSVDLKKLRRGPGHPVDYMIESNIECLASLSARSNHGRLS